MADEQLKVFVDVVTNRAVSELKKLKKATEDSGKELEDTRTEAQKVADRIDAVTQAMVADMMAAEKAADALALALGPEMSTAIGRAGITEFVADLKRAGLTAADVEGDADRLAQTLKNIDQAKAPLRDVDDHMKRLKDTTDNSRSVMANFTGNALQNIPLVSGAMGPLNTAIGQFAEYAVDGNIKLDKFVKTAAGIGGAAIAFQLLADWAGKAAREQAAIDQQTGLVADSLTDVVDKAANWKDTVVSLANAEEVLSEALITGSEEAATLKNALGAMGVEGKDAFATLSAVKRDPVNALRDIGKQMGLTADLAGKLAEQVNENELQLQELSTWEGDVAVGADIFRRAAEEAGYTVDEYNRLYNAAEQLQDIAENTDFDAITSEFLNAQVAAGGLQAETVAAAEEIAGISMQTGPVEVFNAFIDLANQMVETEEAARIYQERVVENKAVEEAYNEVLADTINKHRSLAKLMMSLESAQMAVADEYDALIQTEAEWGDGVGDNAEEMRNLRQSQIDMADSLIDLSLKKIEANGIDKDSAEGVQAQIDELKRLQDQYPLVKSEVQKYIDELLRIPGTVNTNLTLNGRVFGQSEIVGPGGTSMTPTNPGGNTGTNPGAGGTTIIVNGALDPVAVADQIDRMMRDYNLRNGSI